MQAEATTVDRSSVTKSKVDAYTIRSSDGMDYARIFLKPDVREDGAHAGSITINSSFGCFGCYFANTGPQTLSQFLQGLNFGYLMGKLFGERFNQFDADATVRALKKTVTALRRNRELSTEGAERMWSALTDIQDRGPIGLAEFHEALSNQVGSLYADLDLAEVSRFTKNPQALGFWDKIWPHFLTVLAKEDSRKTIRRA